MMDIFDVLTLIGGLCLFLFGMNLMGDALERCAGSKLEIMIGKLTMVYQQNSCMGRWYIKCLLDDISEYGVWRQRNSRCVFDGTSWTTGDARIENAKTGFGSIARYGANGLVVAAHTGNASNSLKLVVQQ